MSPEWSRIEPFPGEFSEEAMKHYRDEIRLLVKNNIKPLVTLHHFSEPIWFQDMGGWKKPFNCEYFIRYVRYVVENLGDLVSDWVTFNEPINTHVRVYKLIHDIRREHNFNGKTMVGCAMHLRVFDAITATGKMVAKAVNYYFNELLMVGTTTGRFLFPLSLMGGGDKKGIYVDFLGINYYTRNIVEFVFDPSQYFYLFVNDRSLGKSDLGWDIYPEGIYRVCKKYYDRYRLPIFITENGISDRKDNKRPDFIADHLYYIAKAITEGIQIERYYYWTLMDNFEWLEGETTSFGLYECNFKTQERTARKSAQLYADICKNKGLTKDMIEKFSKSGHFTW